MILKDGEMDIESSKNLAKEIDNSFQKCLQCGTCTASCPSGEFTALRTRKLIRRAQLGFIEDILSSEDLWYCTTCYTCVERCPRSIDITDIILTLRNMAVKEGRILEAHRDLSNTLIETGHVLTFGEKHKKLRENFGLSQIPSTTLSNKEATAAVKKLAKNTGYTELIRNKVGE
ncbi:MAG: CoB--CoM heterodisulfide reductase subunit C [Candidatus Methanofastidiosia archaeon]